MTPNYGDIISRKVGVNIMRCCGVILDTIKDLLGINDDYSPFDNQLVIYINTAFMGLQQMGVGPKNGFKYIDHVNGHKLWDDYKNASEGLTEEDMEAVKLYVYYKVKKMFDPPNVNTVMTALDNTIQELEWRLHFLANTGK